MGRQYAALTVQPAGHGSQIVFRKNGTLEVLKTSGSSRLKLRVQVKDGGACFFSFSEKPGHFTALADVFQAQPGIWIGAKVGLVAWSADEPAGGWADFDYFRFTAPRAD
jgi:hypothetical protein